MIRLAIFGVHLPIGLTRHRGGSLVLSRDSSIAVCFSSQLGMLVFEQG
jgi:hypothetical protein